MKLSCGCVSFFVHLFFLRCSFKLNLRIYNLSYVCVIFVSALLHHPCLKFRQIARCILLLPRLMFSLGFTVVQCVKIHILNNRKIESRFVHQMSIKSLKMKTKQLQVFFCAKSIRNYK